MEPSYINIIYHPSVLLFMDSGGKFDTPLFNVRIQYLNNRFYCQAFTPQEIKAYNDRFGVDYLVTVTLLKIPVLINFKWHIILYPSCVDLHSLISPYHSLWVVVRDFINEAFLIDHDTYTGKVKYEFDYVSFGQMRYTKLYYAAEEIPSSIPIKPDIVDDKHMAEQVDCIYANATDDLKCFANKFAADQENIRLQKQEIIIIQGAQHLLNLIKSATDFKKTSWLANYIAVNWYKPTTDSVWNDYKQIFEDRLYDDVVKRLKKKRQTSIVRGIVLESGFRVGDHSIIRRKCDGCQLLVRVDDFANGKICRICRSIKEREKREIRAKDKYRRQLLKSSKRSLASKGWVKTEITDDILNAQMAILNSKIQIKSSILKVKKLLIHINKKQKNETNNNREKFSKSKSGQ